MKFMVGVIMVCAVLLLFGELAPFVLLVLLGCWALYGVSKMIDAGLDKLLERQERKKAAAPPRHYYRLSPALPPPPPPLYSTLPPPPLSD